MRKWRIRFDDKGLADFGTIASGRGRKLWLESGTVEAVVHDTLHATPDDGSTHWTTDRWRPVTGSATLLQEFVNETDGEPPTPWWAQGSARSADIAPLASRRPSRPFPRLCHGFE